jgi:hypothetical protein
MHYNAVDELGESFPIAWGTNKNERKMTALRLLLARPGGRE